MAMATMIFRLQYEDDAHDLRRAGWTGLQDWLIARYGRAGVEIANAAVVGLDRMIHSRADDSAATAIAATVRDNLRRWRRATPFVRVALGESREVVDPQLAVMIDPLGSGFTLLARDAAAPVTDPRALDAAGQPRRVIYEWPPGEHAGVIELWDARTGEVLAAADTRDRERWPSDAEHVRRDMARRWLAGVAAAL